MKRAWEFGNLAARGVGSEFAHNFGLLCLQHALLWGIVAASLGHLGFQLAGEPAKRQTLAAA